MKTVQKYICECCGAEYRTEADAEKCESKHKHVRRVVYEYFNSPRSGKDGKYPYEISVDIEGVYVTYRMVTSRRANWKSTEHIYRI